MHELFPSTPTLAASALSVAVGLPPNPALPLIHLGLVSPTGSPRLYFPQKSPKLSSHSQVYDLAQDSAVFGI